jgi:hypothetical protein
MSSLEELWDLVKDDLGIEGLKRVSAEYPQFKDEANRLWLRRLDLQTQQLLRLGL